MTWQRITVGKQGNFPHYGRRWRRRAISTRLTESKKYAPNQHFRCSGADFVRHQGFEPDLLPVHRRSERSIIVQTDRRGRSTPPLPKVMSFDMHPERAATRDLSGQKASSGEGT